MVVATIAITTAAIVATGAIIWKPGLMKLAVNNDMSKGLKGKANTHTSSSEKSNL